MDSPNARDDMHTKLMKTLTITTENGPITLNAPWEADDAPITPEMCKRAIRAQFGDVRKATVVDEETGAGYTIYSDAVNAHRKVSTMIEIYVKGRRGSLVCLSISEGKHSVRVSAEDDKITDAQLSKALEREYPKLTFYATRRGGYVYAQADKVGIEK